MIQIDMEMPESCEICFARNERGGRMYCQLLNEYLGEIYFYPTHIECYWSNKIKWKDGRLIIARCERWKMNDEVKTYVEGKREPHIVIEMPMPRDCVECPLTYPIHDGGAE